MPDGLDRSEVGRHLLGLPRRPLRGCSRRGTGLAGRVEPLGDLLVPPGERPQHTRRDAGDLGRVLMDRPPLHTERGGQLAAHRRLEHRPTSS